MPKNVENYVYNIIIIIILVAFNYYNTINFTKII